MRRIASGQQVTEFPFDLISATTQRVELRFENLIPPVQSFAVRVFVETPRADAHTPTENNPNYLGTQFFYGLGAQAPETPDPLAMYSQSSPTEVRLNITQRVQAYVAQTMPHLAPISLVAVDRHGIEIPDPDLICERISITTR